jgi:pimeloyl-ACP methyl ester carboxylesterase
LELAYQSYGAGEPLIILHGLFGARDNWHTLSRKLGARYHVFAVDQRNHGNSPHSDRFDYDVMAEDLHAFVEQHGLQHVNVMGHSMGGKTAMQFALRYPACLARLIVADIAPKAYPAHHDEIFDAMCALDLAALHTRQELDSALAPRVPDTATRQLIMKNVGRDEHGAFTWKLNLDAIKQNYDAILGNIAGDGPFLKPTLFMRGELSNYVQASDEPAIRRLFPEAQIVTVSGAGHWIHAEKPAEVLKIVEDFLEGNKGTRE